MTGERTLQMPLQRGLLAALIVVSIFSGCSRVPSQVHEVIFEKSNFATPFGVDAGRDDGAARVEWAKRNSVNTGFIPTLILSQYNHFDKRLLSFLVQRGYSKVECVAMTHATEPNPCFLVHNANVTDLGHVASRRLDSITYSNKYDSNVQGTSVTVVALTFKYRIEVTDKQFPAITQVFDGAGKAVLNPDTGGWQLMDLSLTDKGPLIFYEYIHSQYKPYDPTVQASAAEKASTSEDSGKGTLASSPKTPEQPNQKTAPEQIVDRGVCPFEGCQYGEQWMATKSVDVYLAPPEAVDVALASLHKKTALHAGTWVTTTTGLILSKRHEGRIDLRLRPTIGAGITNPPVLKDNQAISLYSYLGEGCWRSWIDGRIMRVCNVNSTANPQNEWWVRIKTEDGSEAWAQPASFVSRAGLNDTLADRIEDPKLPLSEKITQIDALLKAGASFGGEGTKYGGKNPINSAIVTKNVELLKILISKGLNIRDGQSCPARTALSVARDPGGDSMLEFLLANGMPLNCLFEPPITSALRMNIAADNYSVDRAIQIAEILVKHGASVNQKDSRGNSVFDMLDRLPANTASRAAVLKGALLKMEVGRSKTLQADGPVVNGVVYRVGEGTSMPIILHKVEAEYSEEARKLKRQGTVVLKFVVDESGHPRDITVERGVGLGLDEKAIEALGKWLFKPAMKDGKPVAVYLSSEMTFHML